MCDVRVFRKSTREHENSVCKRFNPGERFKRVSFSVTENAGYVWAEGENE